MTAHHDARTTVVGDQVTRDGGGPTDCVVAGSVEDLDTTGCVGQGYGTRRVGADGVARHNGIGRAVNGDAPTVVAIRVARDDVPLAGVIDAEAVGSDPTAGVRSFRSRLRRRWRCNTHFRWRGRHPR